MSPRGAPGVGGAHTGTAPFSQDAQRLRLQGRDELPRPYWVDQREARAWNCIPPFKDLSGPCLPDLAESLARGLWGQLSGPA